MSIETNKAGFYGDFSALAALKKDARAHNPDALRAAAQEFESLFTNMMLKSMRSAGFGDALTGSSDMDFYQGMSDQQLASQLSKGKGMGLADMLVQQLTRSALVEHEAAQEIVDSKLKVEGKNPAPTAAALNPTTAHSPQSTAAAHANFISTMLPHAQQAAASLGVDPALLVAHAALETGWGRHMPTDASGRSSFNLFGIKADVRSGNAHVMANTQEFVAGKPTTDVAAFRAYASPAEAFADYSALLGRSRYTGVRGVGADGDQFAHALQSAGYATDPNYANKLKAVIASVRQTLAAPGTQLATGQVIHQDAVT